MTTKKKKPAPKKPDKDAKNDPSMYQDPMRNIAAGGTGYNPKPDEPQPKKK